MSCKWNEERDKIKVTIRHVSLSIVNPDGRRVDMKISVDLDGGGYDGGVILAVTMGSHVEIFNDSIVHSFGACQTNIKRRFFPVSRKKNVELIAARLAKQL